jgi:hypothetical protein
MLCATTALKGYTIEATDGAIGTVSDVLFDDRTWNLRWLVVDTGGWLTGRKVLIHPSAIGLPLHEQETLPVRLTKAQVEASPDILQDQPVSRQMESQTHAYYGWDPLWGSTYFGADSTGMSLSALPEFGGPLLPDAYACALGAEDGDPHLRSAEEVIGYHLQATDGPIGHVENALIDDVDWRIHYLIVDTRNWWPGKRVLMSPFAVQGISWSTREIRVSVTRDQVKASPEWDPLAIIDTLYEKQLHSHYGWPGHGW